MFQYIYNLAKGFIGLQDKNKNKSLTLDGLGNNLVNIMLNYLPPHEVQKLHGISQSMHARLNEVKPLLFRNKHLRENIDIKDAWPQLPSVLKVRLASRVVLDDMKKQIDINTGKEDKPEQPDGHSRPYSTIFTTGNEDDARGKYFQSHMQEACYVGKDTSSSTSLAIASGLAKGFFQSSFEVCNNKFTSLHAEALEHKLCSVEDLNNYNPLQIALKLRKDIDLADSSGMENWRLQALLDNYITLDNAKDPRLDIAKASAITDHGFTFNEVIDLCSLEEDVDFDKLTEHLNDPVVMKDYQDFYNIPDYKRINKYSDIANGTIPQGADVAFYAADICYFFRARGYEELEGKTSQLQRFIDEYKDKQDVLRTISKLKL